jgi:hypothetical protein
MDLPFDMTCSAVVARRGYSRQSRHWPVVETAAESTLTLPVDNEAGRAFYLARGYREDYRMSRYYADEMDGATYVKFFTAGVVR